MQHPDAARKHKGTKKLKNQFFFHGLGTSAQQPGTKGQKTINFSSLFIQQFIFYKKTN